jgi:hypothetical protein
MADWMPTTAQVRSGYAVDPEGEYRDPINAASNERAAEREFNRWLEAHDRQVKADAWDEGIEAGVDNPTPGDYDLNPYRKGGE